MAQFGFVNRNDVTVLRGGDTLNNAWAGGINYGQVSDFDYDYDGDMDLFVFDRSSNNVIILEQQQSWNGPIYKSVYNAYQLFPQDLRYRAVLVDYDQDGRKDLFAYGIGGLSVYRNVGDATSGLQWTLVEDLVYSQYSSNYSNLYIGSSDIPAIVDVDNDSDIDILTFDISGQHVEYHQNQSMELYGIPDSLIYVQKNECWGLFSENSTTNSLVLNDPNSPCVGGNIPNPQKSDKPTPNSGVFKHSGSTLLALDYDNSGVMDLVIGDVSYTNLNLLINGGSAPNTNSAMISVDSNFPSNTTPANVELFPASFFVDVDFDGIKDLVVCPNAKNISENETSVHYFKNIGTNQNPNFIFQNKNHLQNEMIEHGTGTMPTLFDYNEDGLKDLVIGNFFRFLPGLNKESTVALYLNTGTANNPVYTYIDYDIFNLGNQSYGLRSVPAFGDIDNDGDEDLFLGLENGTITFYENLSTGSGAVFSSGINNYQDNTGATISSGGYCYPQLFDLDKDNLLDLILGRKDGSISFYRNIGTSTAPSFELQDNTLGEVNVATLTPDGYATPHFFRHNDTTHLFIGADNGTLWYYSDIDDHIDATDTFHLVAPEYIGISTGKYSSFWVDDIDNDGNLDLFTGHDLGGILHFEAEPGNTIGLNPSEESNYISLYPNPNNGSFHLESSILMNEVEVLDSFGRTVHQVISNAMKTVFDIDLQRGVYLVRIKLEDGKQEIKRLVID